jgi:hypothetical protein
MGNPHDRVSGKDRACLAVVWYASRCSAVMSVVTISDLWPGARVGQC